MSVSELPPATMLNAGAPVLAQGTWAFMRSATDLSGGAAGQAHNNLQPYEIDNVLVRVA